MPKPKFISDADMEKRQPAEQRKARFLSDAEMEKYAWEPAKDPGMETVDWQGKGEAALQGVGQVGTFGLLPHAQAKLEPVTDRLLNLVTGGDVEPAPWSQLTQSGPEYLKARDAALTRDQDLKDKHPGAYLAGQIGGVVATAPMMGAGLSKLPGMAKTATGLLGRATQAAAGGAVQGAFQNPGDTLGVVDPLQADERISNAKTGAAFGGGASVAGGLAAKAIRGGGSAFRAITSAVTGVPKKEIETYARATDEVNRLIKTSGGDMTEAADIVRSTLQEKIRSKRQELSGVIGAALKSADPDAAVSVKPIVRHLEMVRERMNPRLKSEAVAELDDIISKVQGEAVDGGLSIASLHEVKEFLQDQAKASYLKGGQIFARGKEAAGAAKQAAAEARKLLNLMSPEIQKANNQLSLLHSLEDRLNPNLLAPGRPDGALMAAGSGGNPRNAKMLRRLGDAAGMDALGAAETLAAAREFADPSLLPIDKTGKSLTRLATSAGIGTAIAGPVGTAVGGALASPAALKGLINAGNYVPAGVRNAIAGAPGLLNRAASKLTTQPSVYSGGLLRVMNDPDVYEAVTEGAPPGRLGGQGLLDRQPARRAR